MFKLNKFFKSMIKINAILFLTLTAFTDLNSQQLKSPKLVVGIVVDQMREEYLYRFYNQYSEKGFKRLMNEGFNCRNLHYNYIPTVTGPGHTSIYAGTTPSIHGIISNDWYCRKLKHSVYCVDDSTESIVGIESTKTGASPRNLIPTNIADELKICTNQNSKVIGISLKDRAAVLPAGHMANAAYWLDLHTGKFITSTYYMQKLPDWVNTFNNSKAYKYITSVWTPLLPEKDYPLSLADDNPYEGVWKGLQKPVFPYNLVELAQNNPPYFDVFYSSPFGDDLLTDFCIEAIENENLGKGSYPDLLAISFSSPDAIGHRFGPLSKEINDTYLRLDADIARLLDVLDKTAGPGNYIVFLTADHGVAEVPQYLIDHNVPAGYIDNKELFKQASEFLKARLGSEENLIEGFSENQFYLNKELLNEKGLNLNYVENLLASYLRDKNGIARVFTGEQLYYQEYTYNIPAEVQNGFYYKRSGDVVFITEPGWTDTNAKTGTTHSSGYAYDTHVPMLWYGFGIARGESFVRHNITDIAPTLSALLNIKLPGACTGNPIIEVLKK